MFKATILEDRGIVEVSGQEARPFLQGLVTNDVINLAPAHARYAALLTPQGKIIYDFIIIATPEALLLDCARLCAADLSLRLKKYRLRAKVSITDKSGEMAVYASPEPSPSSFADPRFPALGHRSIANPATEQGASGETYHLHRLELGVPDSTDIPPETFFPLDCNFEELNGVDFNKGCYVGQELTSRMKHRATARRRMLPVSATGALPPPGTLLKIGDRDIGEMRGSVGTRGMALIRLDRLGESTNVVADNVQIFVHRPAYPLILAET